MNNILPWKNFTPHEQVLKRLKTKMYVFYSVSLVLLTSVIKVVCGEQDVCAEWSRTDSLMGLSGYPGRYVDDEKHCQRLCVADEKCAAITWDQNGEVQCNFHKAQDTSTNYSPGSTYWKLKRAGKCRVDCTDSIQSDEGSVTVPSARIFKASHNFPSCKRECIARSNCYAFEWWPNKAAGLGCYFQYDIGFTRSVSSNSNVTIFTIGRPWCKEPIDTKNVVSGTCAVWRKTLYTKGESGLVQPHIDNEEVCRRTCMVVDFCEAVTWIQQDAQCHLHREKVYFGIAFHVGSVYWELQKLRKCGVDCTYAISARMNTGFDQSPPVLQSANTFPACKTECLAKPQCFGFEWRPVGVAGQKCFPQFLSRSKTQTDAQSTIYDFERPSCIEPTTQNGAPPESMKTSDISIESPPLIGKPLEEPSIDTTRPEPATGETTPEGAVKSVGPATDKSEVQQIIVKPPVGPSAVATKVESEESNGSAKLMILLVKIIGGVAALLLIGIAIFIVFIRKKVVPMQKAPEVKEENKEAGAKGVEPKKELEEKEHPERMYEDKKNTRRKENRIIKDKKMGFKPNFRGARENLDRLKGGRSPRRDPSMAPSRVGQRRDDTPSRFGRSMDDTPSRFGRSRDDTPSRFGRSMDDTPSRVGRSRDDTPSRVGRRRDDTPPPIVIVREVHNNNPSMPSIISSRRNNKPDTTFDSTENNDKTPKLTSLTEELQEKSAQSNRKMERWNTTRHNITSTKTAPNNRYTETLEMFPLRSKAKGSIMVITPVEQSRSESQENIVKCNIAKVETPSYKPDSTTLETTPLILKSMS